MSEDTLLWRRIDRSIESTPSNLNTEDICFYFRDYIDGGYGESRSNQLVLNLKITPYIKTENPWRWPYKVMAIEQCVLDYRQFFDRFLPANSSIPVRLVPMPPSKAKASPEYDNRMALIAERLAQIYPTTAVCDIFDVKWNMTPAHQGGSRIVSEIKDALIIEDAPLTEFSVVFLLDDMITSGAHYIACKELLQERYPRIVVAGLFWSRKKHEDPSYYYFNANAGD